MNSLSTEGNVILDIKPNKKTLKEKIIIDFKKNKYIYFMMTPVLIFYILFCYQPIYGATIAFKNFSPGKGIIGSSWIGFKHFKAFFSSVYCLRIIKNTIVINIYNLIFGFPAPIILALLLNEIRNNFLKRTVQTISYLPHFISVMVICGMIIDFTSSKGVINDIVALFGGKRSTMLLKPELFRTIFVGSDIWQEIGWNSIIYIAAISAIDPEQYEAAKIDGAGKLKQMRYITLPGIMSTIVILLILRIGQMMNVGFEKIILLYNPSTYETADVISSFVYRKGLLEYNYSFSVAVGLFNSIVNFMLLLMANKVSRRVNQTSLW